MPKPLKILIVTNKYPPLIDGVGDFSFELSNRLKKRNFDCVVCTLRNPEILAPSESKTNNSLFFVGDEWNLLSYVRLRKYLKANQIDIILLQYVPHGYSSYGLPFHLIVLPLMAFFLKIRLDTIFHEVSVRVKGAGLKSSVLGILQLSIAYLLSFFSNKIYTTNKRYVTYLRPFKASLIFIPPNIYNTEPAAFAKSSVNESDFSIVSFLSRCDDKLLEAFKLFMIKSNTQPKLLLVGCSSNIDFVNETIKKKGLGQSVLIISDHSADTIANIIQSAHIYVQIEKVGKNCEGGISTKSGCLATALSLGKSIISTQGDLTDLNVFVDKHNVFFVQYGDVESYADALLELYNNRSILEKMEINSSDLFNRSFSWSVCIDKIENSLLN